MLMTPPADDVSNLRSVSPTPVRIYTVHSKYTVADMPPHERLKRLPYAQVCCPWLNLMMLLNA